MRIRQENCNSVGVSESDVPKMIFTAANDIYGIFQMHFHHKLLAWYNTGKVFPNRHRFVFLIRRKPQNWTKYRNSVLVERSAVITAVNQSRFPTTRRVCETQQKVNLIRRGLKVNSDYKNVYNTLYKNLSKNRSRRTRLRIMIF